MSRRAGVIGVGLIMALTAASAAGAQTHVGKNVEGGMHWPVAAPQGASWLLTCRFPPVTYWESAYDQNHWINKLERPGEGSDRGRLPLNVGHCHVTKTGGRGPVGVALVREPREVRAEGTAVTGRRVGVGFL